MSDVYVQAQNGDVFRLSVLTDADFDRITKPYGEVVGCPVYINESRTKIYPQIAEGLALFTLEPFTLRSP